jgi:hypothetical protein
MIRYVYASDTGHLLSLQLRVFQFFTRQRKAVSDPLTLALLVARILADDPNDAIALENLAISADLLD